MIGQVALGFGVRGLGFWEVRGFWGFGCFVFFFGGVGFYDLWPDLNNHFVSGLALLDSLVPLPEPCDAVQRFALVTPSVLQTVYVSRQRISVGRVLICAVQVFILVKARLIIFEW